MIKRTLDALGLEMKSKRIPGVVTIAVLLAVFGSMAVAAQDKYTLKAPNGVAFSEFRGYEAWQTVAVSETPTAASPSASSSAMGQEDGLKAILGNPVMIKAYKPKAPAPE